MHLMYVISYSYSYFLSKQPVTSLLVSYNVELIERAAFFEWLNVYWLFQDFLVFSNTNLHDMGDWLNIGLIESSGWVI